MQRLWHRLNRVPSQTKCIYCNTLTKSFAPKKSTPIFPLELFRSYNANSLFSPEKNIRPLELEDESLFSLPKNTALIMADFYRSLSTQDMDRIWPLYTYLYNNDLLHYLTRKNFHNLFVYTTRSRATQKNLHRLTALVDDMKLRGFSLKLAEYNALISWVGGKTVPQKHSHHLNDALKIFDEMQQPFTVDADGEKIPKESIQPDVPTFNSLIHIAAQLSDLRTAQKLYHDMLSRGLQPDRYTFCTLLHVMGKLGDINGMDLMLKEMKQQRLNKLMKHTVIWNAVMSGYAMNGLKDRAYAMFQQMVKVNSQKRGQKFKKYSGDIPRADAHSFRIYIELLLKEDRREEAILTLNQMQALGVKPIVTIYNMLFKSFSDYGYSQDIEDNNEIDTVHNIYQHMKDTQVKPNSETMYTLVSAFLDLGDTKSALEVFVSLSTDDKPKEHCNPSSIQTSSVSNLVKQTKANQIKKCEPLNIKPRPDLLERLNSIIKKPV